MDGKEVLIVNLAPKGATSPENARLVGALLMSELRLCAMSRDPATARSRPFSLYIDECYDYLTGDVERMLDETRKFGLHVVLAHQRLGQLRARSDAIFNGVMAGGQTKIVFGGMSDDDAEIMAREILRSSFNLERPKHVLDKPLVVDEVPYWLESESSSESTSYTDSSSQSAGWTTGSVRSEGHSEAYWPDATEPFQGVASFGTSVNEGMSGGETSGHSETTSAGRTWGRSQTLKPVRVMMPTAVHSLEEELHLAIVKLRELPLQAAVTKRLGKPPVRFRPTTVKPAIAWPELTARFVADARGRSAFVRTREAAETEIELRATTLSIAREEGKAPEPEFWSE